MFIEDRKKELIKVKGLQVAPAELENTIRSMEGVVDVAVIGSVAQFNTVIHIQGIFHVRNTR